MFNTYRETTGCYGDVNVDSYPQNVDDSEKVSPNAGPAWNMHASGPSGHGAHGAHHTNHPGHSAHSPVPANYHSAFHHHTANPAVDSFGYSLAQAPLKENDPTAGKDVIRSSPPPTGAAPVAWQNNRARSRYPSTVVAGAFLPYPTQLNPYDGPPLEAAPHGMAHSHMLGRKQSWSSENLFANIPSGGQYQRNPSSAMYGENIRGNVSGGIIRHTTNVSPMEVRNSSSQQHQAVPQHVQHQQQSILHHQQQQHSAPHHQLLCQLVQKEREAHRLPGYQERHSVVRSRISGYPEPLFPQHQHPQYCSSQDVLRKGPLPVPMDGDRRSAFTARQTAPYAHGPSNWNKNAVPFMPSFHAPQMLAPHRGGGSAFQPCNKAGEHELYPESLIWSKSGQPDHGGHMQGQAAWMHDAQSQMFLSRQMNKQSRINSNSNVLGVDSCQMGMHPSMQSSGGRQPVNMPKGASVSMVYHHPQQHLHLHNPHMSSQMMHQSQAAPQHALQQQPMMQQHQSSPLSNSHHSPMVTSPQDMNSPQMVNPCSQQPSQPQQQQTDTQLICNEANGKESRSRSLRNCLDVRQFLENWDEDTDVGTPRPCVDETETGENVDQPLDTTEEALVVLDCRSLRREEAANLLNMYSVPEAEGLLACSGEGMFSTGTDTVAQSALQNLLDSVTSSGSNSTTIATPMASPTGHTGGRSLDMLLNAALPTPPASQEHNNAQTNLPLSTPVAVVSLNSPISPHLGDTIRQPKMDETGFGVLSPTSPAASVKFTCATVNTPFVKFPSADDPPSVIQSSRDHMGFSAAHQFSCDKDSNMVSPSASKAADQPPVSVPVMPAVTAHPSTVEPEVSPSPALSDASTESKMTTSLRAFRKQKTHSPDRISEAPDSFDSHSHDTSDVHPRSSRTSSVLESDDAVDRSQWAFAQITKTSRTSSREDFTSNVSSIIKSTQGWQINDGEQDIQNFKLKPYSSTDYSMVDKSTAPLICGLETQKSDSSKFDKSTSPTIFLTNKDTQTEESRQISKRIDSCAFNDTFAQTSVRCLQDEIHHETFAQTSVNCLQDEIHHDSFAQTSVLSLHEELENLDAQETLSHNQDGRLRLNQTELPRVESLSKETEDEEQSHTHQIDVSNEGAQVPFLNECVAQDIHLARAEAVNSYKCSTSSSSNQVATESDKNQVPSNISENEVNISADVWRSKGCSTDVVEQVSPLKPDLDHFIKVSALESTELNQEVDGLKTNEVAESDRTSESCASNVKIPEAASCADDEVARTDTDGDEKSRSVGTGTNDECINNELCPKYLSRIVDSSPGNIPKILLSRLREKSSKKNGVIKRLPSIRLTRVCSPMSSCGSDPEYVCSVSDTEPGTPSKYDCNTTDSVLSDVASHDHKKTSTSHRKNKRAKHCDVEVQSSPLSMTDVCPAEHSEAESKKNSSIDRHECHPSIKDIACPAGDSFQVSTSESENTPSEVAGKCYSEEGRSVDCQTEKHLPLEDILKNADDVPSTIPQSTIQQADDWNEINTNPENVSSRSPSLTSQEIFSTKHLETDSTKTLSTYECKLYKPDVFIQEKASEAPAESLFVVSSLMEEEPCPVLTQPKQSPTSVRKHQSTPRSSPQADVSIMDPTPSLETEPMPDVTHVNFSSVSSIDELNKEEAFVAVEEKEFAMDLSVQRTEYRREGSEEETELDQHPLTSPQSNSPVVEVCELPMVFPGCKELSPSSSCQEAGENVNEKEELKENVNSFSETVRQSKDPTNYQEEAKSSLNLPDLSEEEASNSPLMEKLLSPENISLAEESGLHSSRDNVFLSPRIPCKRLSIDICEKDIAHSSVNQNEFFETENCLGELSSPPAKKNISQENTLTVEESFREDQAVEICLEKPTMSSTVEVASAHQNDVIRFSEVRGNPMGAGTSNVSEYLSDLGSKESVPKDKCKNSSPEKPTFSEPVAYSDLFRTNSNDSTDVIVTNPFITEEISQRTPEIFNEVDINIQESQQTRPTLSNESFECSDKNSTAQVLGNHSETLRSVNEENLPTSGCEENHTSNSPSCSSHLQSDCDISAVCEDKSSTGANNGDICPYPNEDFGKEDNSVLEFHTNEMDNHEEDVQPTPDTVPEFHTDEVENHAEDVEPTPDSAPEFNPPVVENHVASIQPTPDPVPESNTYHSESHVDEGQPTPDPVPESNTYNSESHVDEGQPTSDPVPESNTYNLESHVDEGQQNPATTPDSVGSLVLQANAPSESGGIGSQNFVCSSDVGLPCENETQVALDDVVHQPEVVTPKQEASTEEMVESSISKEVATNVEGSSSRSLPDVVETCRLPSIEQSTMDQIELPSHQQEQRSVSEETNFVICLSDIPLPSEEGYKKYLAKRNSLAKSELVINESSEVVRPSKVAYSRHFSVQVEENEGVTTADKDTQSSDDSFTLSDEEKAFPDPLAPNFDVARIPLPDECIAIKNRILKSKNKKRPRERCNNECCTSIQPSEVNATASSVGTQCTKPRDVRSFLSLRNKASQTHKIQIKLKPRRPSSSSGNSLNNQTLMEIVEEVSKVLHDVDGGECTQHLEEKEKVSPISHPEDTPRACEYVIEPNRSKNCKSFVEEVLSVETDQLDDCDFLKVRSKEVFPVNGCGVAMEAASSLVVNVGGSPPKKMLEKDRFQVSSGQKSTNVTLNPTAGSSPSYNVTPLKSATHCLDSPCITNKTSTSCYADPVGRNKESADSLTLAHLPTSPPTELNNISSCGESCEIQEPFSTSSVDLNLTRKETSESQFPVKEITAHLSEESMQPGSSSFSCASPVLDQNILEICKSNDKDCLRSSSSSSTDEKCEESLLFQQEKSVVLNCQSTEVHGPLHNEPELGWNGTEANPLDLIAEDCHEKCQDLSTIDDSASLNGKEDAFSRDRICVEPLFTKPFGTDHENFNKRNESEVVTCNSNPVVSDVKKTEVFENKLENDSDSKKFLKEEQRFPCDKQERENVPCVEEDLNLTPNVGTVDQFVYSENKKEETASWEAVENSYPNHGETNLPLIAKAEEAITSYNARKEDPCLSSQKNIPSNLGDKVPIVTTVSSSLCVKPDDTTSNCASEPNFSFGDVHMAVGKKVIKLSSEWQTVYLSEEGNEKIDMESSDTPPSQDLASLPEENAEDLLSVTEDLASKSQESNHDLSVLLVESSSVEPPINEPIPELVDNDEVGPEDSNEYDLPPLDAPGLEAENTADSDSDREMPCLQPESADQVIPNILVPSDRRLTRSPPTPCEGNVSPSACSQSVQEPAPADHSALTSAPTELQTAAKDKEALSSGAEEGMVTPIKVTGASPTGPVFPTWRLPSTRAPRKDMPAKRPCDSDESDSGDSDGTESDGDSSSGSDTGGPCVTTKGARKRLRAEAEPEQAAEAEAEAEHSEQPPDLPVEDLILAEPEAEADAQDLPLAVETEAELLAVSEAIDVYEVAEDVSEAVAEMGEVLLAGEEENAEHVVEAALEQVAEAEAVDRIEISDIRTDPAEWSGEGVVYAAVATPEDAAWRCVEIISTEESVREEVVETVAEHEDEVHVEDSVGEDGVREDWPQLKCSLKLDRLLLAANEFNLGPAKVAVRVEHAGQQATDEAGASPWNVVDRAEGSAAGSFEENNNHLPKSPPPLSHVFKVNKLILKRPAPPSSPDHSTACSSSDHHDSRSPDGGHSLKTKGALKSYHSDDAESAEAAVGSRRRGGSRWGSERSRHRHGKRRWYSHLSPASRSPGAASRADRADGEVPKVIIKRQCSPPPPSWPAWRAPHGRPRPGKTLVVVLERDPKIDAMALRAAARLRRLKRSKELLDGDLDGPSHRHSRGASVRGSSEPRSRRHSPPPRKRSRSVREHDLRRRELRDLPALGMLAEEQGSEEEAEAGSSKRRKKASSAERHDDERRERGRHRQRSRDKDRDRKASRASKAAVVHVNELVRRWQMTPPGKDTPMPMPSPGPAPQYGWHQVDAEAADAEAADAVVEAADDDPEPERELAASPEPEHSHWSRPEDAAGDAVPGDAPLVPPDEPAEGPVDAEVVADGVASAVYTCEACGTELSGEHCPARADHIKQHPYHCQRCYQAFASQGNFTQHLKAAHPNTQELHHCLLCRRTFPNERQHATHMKGPSHCRMERSQRRTIHTLFRMFTGSDCPRLSPLTPEDMHALDWLPNDSGVIHFYHQATPLQLATEYWHLNHGNSSGQSTKEDTPNPE